MKRVIFTLGIIACAVLGNAQGTVSQPLSNAEVKFDKVEHDFGNIAYGGPGAYEFKFKNTGKEPLIINNCQQSCGCTTPVCPKEPIRPGGTGVIKVQYDTKRPGPFNKTVTVSSNAKNGNVVLTIKGKVDAAPKQEEAFPTNNGGTRPAGAPVEKNN